MIVTPEVLAEIERTRARKWRARAVLRTLRYGLAVAMIAEVVYIAVNLRWPL